MLLSDREKSTLQKMLHCPVLPKKLRLKDVKKFELMDTFYVETAKQEKYIVFKFKMKDLFGSSIILSVSPEDGLILGGKLTKVDSYVSKETEQLFNSLKRDKKCLEN